jgi:hypothetical protein
LGQVLQGEIWTAIWWKWGHTQDAGAVGTAFQVGWAEGERLFAGGCLTQVKSSKEGHETEVVGVKKRMVGMQSESTKSRMGGMWEEEDPGKPGSL